MEPAENPKGYMVCLCITTEANKTLCKKQECFVSGRLHQRNSLDRNPFGFTLGAVALAVSRTCPQGSDGCLKTYPVTEWARNKIHKLLLDCAWHNLDEISQESVFPWTTWWRKLCVRSALMAARSLLTTCSLPFVWPFCASSMNLNP